MYAEAVNIKVHGRFEAELVDQQGNVTERFDRDNLVTNVMPLFITGMIGSNYQTISHYALGNGVGSGTLQDPEPHTDASTQLRSETYRMPITGVSYADLNNDLGDTITDGVISNRIIFVGEVADTITPAEIVEIALFGGPFAAAANSGMMTNVITFPVITKPSNLSLRFRWTLTFVK